MVRLLQRYGLHLRILCVEMTHGDAEWFTERRGVVSGWSVCLSLFKESGFRPEGRITWVRMAVCRSIEEPASSQRQSTLTRPMHGVSRSFKFPVTVLKGPYRSARSSSDQHDRAISVRRQSQSSALPYAPHNVSAHTV